jgi:hypothetical protein
MTQKYLIVKAHAEDDWTDVDFAAIPLDEDHPFFWEITRIKMAQQLAEELGEEFYCIELWDSRVQFFNLHDSDDIPVNAERWTELGDFAEVFEGPLPDDAEELYTDCQTLCITKDSIQWKCYIKHTDPPVRISTSCLYKADLDKIFAEVA